ncbi:MAG: aminotransferase class V-fold PLP-dependent enzyme [Cyanobacteriota bacterium]|nr:aminotransferase class V-fold PLP-dependent enzyme [Cyanobacteriota bacterium]
MASESPLYLDACATTPLLPEAQAAMALAQETAWGNPSSLHGYGLAASESLERSRQLLASLLGTTSEAVYLCSGATESVHLALLGVASASSRPARLLISAVEHPAVVAAADQLRSHGWEVTPLPVDAAGRVLLEPLQALLEPPTQLVSVLAAQSEVGTLQPIDTIARLCREAGVLFHTDAVQLAPHQPINFGSAAIDLLTLTAHKLGGPRGVGALLVQPRSRQRIGPLLGGGAQERGLRAGTEAVVLAAGFAAALQAGHQRHQTGETLQLQQLRDRLLDALLELPGVRLSGAQPDQGRLPHHISLILEGSGACPISGRQVVRRLWQQGVAASSGSACSSGSPASAASPVLLAMGYTSEQAAAGLRLSLLPIGAGHHEDQLLTRVPAALAQALAACS